MTSRLGDVLEQPGPVADGGDEQVDLAVVVYVAPAQPAAHIGPLAKSGLIGRRIAEAAVALIVKQLISFRVFSPRPQSAGALIRAARDVAVDERQIEPAIEVEVGH